MHPVPLWKQTFFGVNWPITKKKVKKEEWLSVEYHAQLAFLVLEITDHQGLKTLITALNGKDKNSETHLGSMVTLLLWPFFFGLPGKNCLTFSCKKPLLIWSARLTANFFWPIGNRINRVPL